MAYIPLVILSVLSSAVAYQVSGETEMCQDARSKCLFRSGCSMAMQNYLVHCAEVMTGRASGCSKACQHSLIALTSTEEGQALMRCKCNDTYCESQKERIDVCRPYVQAALRSTAQMPCNVATYLCLADAQCQTALDYYNQFCRAMFEGRRCTAKCKNSISILRKQEKSAGLWTCKCDGTEDYDCSGIRENMAGLCYKRKVDHKEESTVSVKEPVTMAPPKTFPPPVEEIEKEIKRKEEIEKEVKRKEEVEEKTQRPSDRTKIPKKVHVDKIEKELTKTTSASSRITFSWCATLMFTFFVVR